MPAPDRRPPLSHRRIAGQRYDGTRPGSAYGNSSGTFVALALVLLIAVVFAIMLRDGQVAENLGRAFQHWTGQGR